MKTQQTQGLIATIDWIEFTILGIRLEEALAEVLQLPLAEFSPLSKGRFGYQKQLKWSDGNVFIMYNEPEEVPPDNDDDESKKGDTDRMGVHVMISGAGCRQYEVRQPLKKLLLFLTILDERVNFSRIDLAIDDHLDQVINFEQIHSAAIARYFTSRWSKWDELNSRKSATGEFLGRTMYFGSQASDIFCRIYDKALERKANSDQPTDNLPDRWTRLEIIYKKDRAKQLVYYIVDRRTPVGTAVRGTLNQYIRFITPPPNPDKNKSRWPTAEWWSQLLDGVDKLQLTIEREQRSIDDMRDWLEQQIAPTLAAILTAKEGELDWLHEIIGKGAQRLSQRHRDAIAQYLDQHNQRRITNDPKHDK